ncbi:Coiled-coil domain-containing protein 89 [Merluccius polli]|uniref:Coiled-coil domain-containing protein 89 n=1 Tax=Merluccius polli TaxID=89951 RepID=A0AA47MS11_MERPO|nr:Coiled-coil domain-containing protein 89 [Merluccius polli]
MADMQTGCPGALRSVTTPEEDSTGPRVEQQSGSRVEEQQSGSRVEEQQSGSRVEEQQSGSRVEEQQSGSRVEEQQSGSRVEQQSGLICVLKHRADEALLRCRSLQQLNAELEGRAADAQKDARLERRKAALLETRFDELAANHQAMIVFKDEYKSRNSQLSEENTLLRTENEALFSQKLRDNETLVRQLQREIRLNEEKHEAAGKDFKLREHAFPTTLGLLNTSFRVEKEAELQSKLLKLKSLQQSQEAALLQRLGDTQRSLNAAEDESKDLKQQLRQAAEGRVLKETEMKQMIKKLSGERDHFMNLSIERGKVIQEKQEKIQQLKMTLEEVEKVKARAENRFKKEAEAVNVNVKVLNLQCALGEAVKKNEKAAEDFEAYKEHSTNLLAREKELNAKLRHMFG